MNEGMMNLIKNNNYDFKSSNNNVFEVYGDNPI